MLLINERIMFQSKVQDFADQREIKGGNVHQGIQILVNQ